MDEFLKELPALIVTLAVLASATVLIIIAHVGFGDAIAILSPAIAFWFMRGAFLWQPPQQSSPTIRPMVTDWQRRPGDTTPPPPPATG